MEESCKSFHHCVCYLRAACAVGREGFREDISFFKGDTLLSQCRRVSRRSSPGRQEKTDIPKGGDSVISGGYNMAPSSAYACDAKRVVLGGGNQG